MTYIQELEQKIIQKNSEITTRIHANNQMKDRIRQLENDNANLSNIIKDKNVLINKLLSEAED